MRTQLVIDGSDLVVYIQYPLSQNRTIQRKIKEFFHFFEILNLVYTKMKTEHVFHLAESIQELLYSIQFSCYEWVKEITGRL